MSLQTPVKIRNFQRKLYLKAKAEPDFRFYLLYDKIHRTDILLHAYRLAKANGGSAGVDGMRFEHVESQGVDEWLSGIRKELRAKAYSPQAVLRVMIPKPGGGWRFLGIPTIRDRVLQTAAELVLEPIFEADLEPNAYGYRPKRSALDAIRMVHKLLCKGYTDVIDADLSKYFDTIPHGELMQCVARRIVDRHVLRLIKLWLKAPVENRDKDGTWYTGASPMKTSVKPLKQKLRTILRPGEKGAWSDVRDRLNILLRGWCTYFCYGTTQIAYRAVERNVYNRVRRFLVCRHKVRSRGIHKFPSERVFGELGVMLPRPRKYATRRVP
jgi:retron-type reverse transcriptase